MAAAMNRAAGGMGNMQSSPQSMQPGASGSSGMGPMPQQNHMGGGGGNNTFGQNQGQGQGNLISSLSPVQHQGSNPNMQGQQQLFSQGMGGMGMGGGVGGGMGGMGTMDPRMAMGNMSSQQQQRQLLLMQQQQQRVANGMGGGAGQFNSPHGSMNPMMMNQQQQQQQQQLAFQRQQQQQGQGQGPMNSSSPTHPGSPMVPSDFSGPSGGGPPMRSSSTIPGIARRTRSPSDGAPSPLMPRGMPTTRVGSIGQEEYQRMMLQQQHGQAVRAMSSQSPTFNQHQQMMAGGGGGSSNWPQQGGGSNYGMSSSSDNPSGFGTGGGPGVPSPTNNGQSWNTATQGGYPFAPSPSASDHVRNMSATPAPQQQQNQGTTHDSPPADQNITGEFDLFNWNA
jgi:hypothetical protein